MFLLNSFEQPCPWVSDMVSRIFSSDLPYQKKPANYSVGRQEKVPFLNLLEASKPG